MILIKKRKDYIYFRIMYVNNINQKQFSNKFYDVKLAGMNTKWF